MFFCLFLFLFFYSACDFPFGSQSSRRKESKIREEMDPSLHVVLDINFFLTPRLSKLNGIIKPHRVIVYRNIRQLASSDNAVIRDYATVRGYIIIMSCRLRGYPWPSLAISPYHSSPPARLQGYIPCPHTAAVCRFVLVVPLLHIHVWGSTGVHRLWARPCFSSSVLRVWFVELV